MFVNVLSSSPDRRPCFDSSPACSCRIGSTRASKCFVSIIPHLLNQVMVEIKHSTIIAYHVAYILSVPLSHLSVLLCVPTSFLLVGKHHVRDDLVLKVLCSMVSNPDQPNFDVVPRNISACYSMLCLCSIHISLIALHSHASAIQLRSSA